MANIIKTLSTDASKLERWIGKDQIERVSQSMVDWYGPPIALKGVPGEVFAYKGGDFRGKIRDGYEATALDRGVDLLNRIKRGIRVATSPEKRFQLNTGFASLSDLISEATGGKRQEVMFQKTGNTGVVGVTNTLWRVGAQPAAGAVPTTIAGTAPTSANTGAMFFNNASGSDTTHFVAAAPVASVAGNTLLLYDRLFHCLPNMANATAQAISGVPTRYQNTTVTTAQDYVAGNFLFIEVGGTALAATGHNWTPCQYTNQAGTTSQALPSVVGNSGAIGDRLDQPAGTWFCPLASGDTGIKALTQVQCSASVATGVIYFTIGHPLAWMPCPVANMVCTVDGINTAFNLVRIFDSACLALLEVCKPATTATTYSGTITTVQG